MRYIIYGAGGIGSVLGGHLFRTGCEVVLVGNAAHVEAISALGETLAGALTRSGFSARAHPEVMKPKGAKCLTNLGNALEAITDGQGDENALMQAVQREAMQV